MPTIVLLQRDKEASARLRAVIDASPPFSVLASTHTVKETRTLLTKVSPDILVSDLRVQDGEVSSFLFDVRHANRLVPPHVLVTMVSHDDVMLIKALRAGADSYWMHTSTPDALIATLKKVMLGESPISPTIARHVLSHFEFNTPSIFGNSNTLSFMGLTASEREMLQWAAQGYLIDEIASQWQDSVHSVACRVRHVYRKLQLDLQGHHLRLNPG